MKRTFTINLNNAVYHIDNDAYDLLHQYLNEVEARLSADEKKEVMADIEARISELFAEKLQKGKGVINIEDVEEVISILGKPNQFSEEDEEQNQSQSGSTTTGSEKKSKRRFYRDVDNSILGGVASGLAALLGWDVLVIRILMVILIFLSASTIIPIYLIIWIIAPPARTVAQKLEMQGEEATAERIKQEINNLKNYVESDKFKENANHMGSRLGEVFRVIFKVLFGFIGAVMGFVGFILLGVLLLLLSFLIFEPTVFNGFIPEITFFSTGWGVAMIVTLLLIVGIPIFLLIYWAVKIISGRREHSTGTFSWILVIIWFLGIFVFAGLSAKTALQFGEGHFDDFDMNWSIEEDNSPEITEMRVVQPFDAIEISGNIKLDLVQDSIPSVQVKCGEAVMPYLETSVENGILKIRTRKFFVNREVKVNIVNPDIKSLQAGGASEIHSIGKIRSENLKLSLSGASHADLDVHISQDLQVELNGASKADLEGLAYRLHNNTSGASKLKADDLLVRNGRIEGSGASQLECNVTDSLDVRVSGASNFSNNSRPLYLNEHSSGASDIHFR